MMRPPAQHTRDSEVAVSRLPVAATGPAGAMTSRCSKPMTRASLFSRTQTVLKKLDDLCPFLTHFFVCHSVWPFSHSFNEFLLYLPVQDEDRLFSEEGGEARREIENGDVRLGESRRPLTEPATSRPRAADAVQS